MNITEDYCSYEVAKLLKEKGFNEPIRCWYDNFQDFHEEGVRMSNTDCLPPTIMCPTHQMAMKWLREIYHLEINITFGFPFIDGKQQYKYFWSIVRVCDNHLEYPMDDPNSAYYNEEMADYYKEAIEAALKYCLENLI